ncbi:hypothetical protein RUM44_000426 [Polyplax serrata]|uniref:Uncharacterized protein n=1 Tax=Polyplax serrata TaxID=468196 RepID=A0ABR1B8A4_POLSC
MADTLTRQTRDQPHRLVLTHHGTKSPPYPTYRKNIVSLAGDRTIADVGDSACQCGFTWTLHLLQDFCMLDNVTLPTTKKVKDLLVGLCRLGKSKWNQKPGQPLSDMLPAIIFREMSTVRRQSWEFAGHIAHARDHELQLPHNDKENHLL